MEVASVELDNAVDTWDKMITTADDIMDAIEKISYQSQIFILWI